MSDFVEVHRGEAPLVIGLPHSGTDLPGDLAATFVSSWLALKDTDWWIDRLYGFAREMGATVVRTRISRAVIDCNRDPSGASLYPGQATTGLCPTETFDGEPLYDGALPDAEEIASRRRSWFDPYHRALAGEVARLRARCPRVVLYDAHSIRSRIPRLFEGELPHLNVGTDGGRTCDEQLARGVMLCCADSGLSYVRDGRFRGGWTTRHYGRPHQGVHAIQMEVAMRSYLSEPNAPSADTWPSAINADPLVLPTLRQVLTACLTFATKGQL
jgi:N-formylglutamate deformylase